MIWRNGILLLLVLLIGVPSAISAQRRPDLVYDSTGQLMPVGKTSAPAQPSVPLPLEPRRGPWFNVGLGYGSVDCGYGCTMGAPSAELAAGWALSPQFLLGGGITGWTKEGKTGEYEGARLRVTIGSLHLRLRYYPKETAGFFITGGFGAGMFRLSDEQGRSVTQTGGAFLGGFGCDFRIAQHASLTPFASGSAVRTWGSDDMRADVWQLGLGLTIH